MSFSKVDYSEIIEALQQNKEGEVNDLLEELTFRLRDYMRVVLDASQDDSEECAQRALTIAYEQIIQGNIKDEKRIFAYLINVCRNEYFTLKKESRRLESIDNHDYEQQDNYEGHFVDPGDQVQNLMDEDRQKILEVCLDNLKEEYREFIEYLMERPSITTEDASKYFGISEASMRTRKSRILKRLHYCFQRKWNK